MAGSITTAARELARYKLDLAGVQKVKWDKRGKITVEITIFSMEKETKVMN
jgi:hypothetical protein